MEDDRRVRPLNRPDNETLRRVEVAVFSALVLSFCAAAAWRGVLFLLEGDAVFPLLGLSLSHPAGIVVGAFYLLLSGGVALATAAMFLRFLR